MKRFFLLVFLCIIFFQPSQAQILKKIKDKVQDVVSNDEGEQTADTDTTEESIYSEGSTKETYEFNWVYDLEVTDHKGRANTLSYLIPNTGNYFGFFVDDDHQNSKFVYDVENESAIMFMDEDGEKMFMSMKLPKQIIVNAQEEYAEDLNGTLTELAPKTILGKVCQGYQYDTDEYTSKFWIDQTAGVSFYNVFANQKGMDVDQYWPTLFKSGMMMEMEYISKEKKKYNSKMVCTRLEQQANEINTSDYRSMLGF